jgi:uncharacterized RDD family membrane protein YckC
MAAARLDTLQPVELADGVEIQLRVAGPAVRSTAWLLDLLVFLVALLVIELALAYTIAHVIGGEMTQGITMLIMFVMNWFYNVIFESSSRGCTPGQKWMKLRVISVTGGPVTVSQAILRNFLRVIDFMPFLYLTGFLSCLFTKRFQRLGDLVAGTVMVYTDPPPVTLPKTTVNAERRAPPIPLSREEQAALQQFLERAPNWSDERRLELSGILQPLTEAVGVEGLRRLVGMAMWIQEPEAPKPSPPPFR